MRWKRGAFVFWIAGSLLGQNVLIAEDVSLPHAMGVLGDSISEGLLTDFSIEHPPAYRQLIKMLLSIRGAETSEYRIELFRRAYARPEKSWASGSDENDLLMSHYERLKAYVPNLKAHNFARSGARSVDLRLQAFSLLRYEIRQNKTFDYITLMIGANDLKGKTWNEITPVQDYVQNVENTLKVVLDFNAHRKILVVGIPPLLQIIKNSADVMAYEFLKKDISCSQMRKIVYGALLLFQYKDDLVYGRLEKLMEDQQAGLQELVSRLSKAYPQAQLKTVLGFSNFSSVEKILSVDCFHPSLWGQAEIAEWTWIHGFWPDL